MDLNLGDKIRKLRKERGITILRLSELSGVSTGQISQIERGLMTPSVATLWRVSQALQVRINFFFDDVEGEEGIIIREGDHKQILMNKGDAIYQILSPDMKNRQLDFIKVVLKPHQEHLININEVTHEGEECGIVLSGTLTVRLNNCEHVLKEGDSIYFRSNQPHVYLNKGEEECVSIWAMTPPFF